MADSNQEFGTILGADANFKGELQFDSAAKLLGKFEGSITSKGRILVADGAKCKATVKAKEIAVEGNVEGNVEALERIEIKAKGMIFGDITAARMSMVDGASIDGHCRIGVDGQAGRGSSSTELKNAGQPQVQGQPNPAIKK